MPTDTAAAAFRIAAVNIPDGKLSAQALDDIIRIGLALLDMEHCGLHDSETYRVLKSMYREIGEQEWGS